MPDAKVVQELVDRVAIEKLDPGLPSGVAMNKNYGAAEEHGEAANSSLWSQRALQMANGRGNLFNKIVYSALLFASRYGVIRQVIDPQMRWAVATGCVVITGEFCRIAYRRVTVA